MIRTTVLQFMLEVPTKESDGFHNHSTQLTMLEVFKT